MNLNNYYWFFRSALSSKFCDRILKRALKEDFILFFEHDANNECCSLKQGSRGIKLNKTFKFMEI